MALWNSGFMVSFDLLIFGFYRFLRKSGLCVIASRLVPRIFLESYGTLVAVSAPLVMHFHDSDIRMNVPFTSCNKQPNTLLEPVRPEAVLPDRALCLQPLYRPSVNSCFVNNLSLSLSLDPETFAPGRKHGSG
jgi:hypothetical protein